VVEALQLLINGVAGSFFQIRLEPASLVKSRNSIRKTFIEILERIFDNLPM